MKDANRKKKPTHLAPMQNSELMMKHEDYSLFIDSSEVIIDYYTKQDSYGLEKYFVDIEDWLQEERTGTDNLPLLIEAEEGVGKKTLLVKWLEHHQNNSTTDYKDTVITHFASAGGNNTNYFYAIYGILVKLRENFNINQKVELLEDRLGKFFYYWLDICSLKIKKTVVYDGQIIIVIEGIENFIEPDTRKESTLKFWLPKYFPDRVKVIVTAEPDSASAEYLRSLGCHSVKITANEKVTKDFLERMDKKKFNVPDSHKKKIMEYAEKKGADPETKMMILKGLFCTLMPSYVPPGSSAEKETSVFKEIYKDFDYKQLKDISNNNELIPTVVDFYQDRLVSRDTLIRILGILCCTQKGLTIPELLRLVEIPETQLLRVLNLFKVFVMSFRGYWVCNHEGLRQEVMTYYIQNNLEKRATEAREEDEEQPPSMENLHKDIALRLKETQNSIRKLEELTHHLYQGNNTFQLKKTISEIENFLLLFNPVNKFDLFRYWQQLEKLGYDPVIEYNKGIEQFDTHYSPVPDKLFKIILQVCRFLKEFSDFETNFTPDFRHPLIRGKKGVRTSKMKRNEEFYLQQKQVDREKAQAYLKSLQEQEDIRYQEKSPFYDKNPFYTEDNPVREMPQTNKDVRNPRNDTTYAYLEEIGLYDELTNFALVQEGLQKGIDQSDSAHPPREQILQFWECVNVEVPGGRDKFRSNFLKTIEEKYSFKEKLVQADTDEKACYHIEDDQDEQESNQNYQIGQKDARKEGSVQEDEAIVEYNRLIHADDLAIEPEKTPSHYYYKRWIWIIFPWACMSIDTDLQFSAVIGKCYSSATEYMKIEEEKEFNKDALKIAIDYKNKRKLMYAKTEEIQQYKQIQEQKNMQKNEKSKLKRNSTVKSFNKSNSRLHQTSSVKQLPKIKSSSKMSVFQKGDNTLQQSTFLTQGRQGKSSMVSFRPNESSNYEVINSSAFNSSQLNRLGPVKKKVNQRMQNILGNLNMRNNASLKKLDNTLQAHATIEIKCLKEENSKLSLELNDVCYQINSLKKKISKIPRETLAKNGMTLREKMGHDLKILEARNAELLKRLNIVERRKQRMNNIIKICDINSHQNEKWIRDLNKLIGNYEKMIVFEKSDLQKERREIKQLKALNKNYIKEFNKNATKQKDYIQQVQNSIIKQQSLMNKIRSTDNVIHKRLLSEQEDNQKQAKINEVKHEQNMQKNNLEKRRKYMDEEIEKYRSLKVEFSELFSEVEDEEKFEEGPKFEKMIENLDVRKNLLKSLFEVKQRIGDSQDNIDTVNSQIETLKKARSQKGQKTEDQQEDEALQYRDSKSKEELTEELREKEVSLMRAQETYRNKITSISVMKSGMKNILQLNGISEDFGFKKQHQIIVQENLTNKLIDIRHFLSEEQYGLLLQGKLNVKNLLADLSSDEKPLEEFEPLESQESLDQESVQVQA